MGFKPGNNFSQTQAHGQFNKITLVIQKTNGEVVYRLFETLSIVFYVDNSKLRRWVELGGVMESKLHHGKVLVARWVDKKGKINQIQIKPNDPQPMYVRIIGEEVFEPEAAWKGKKTYDLGKKIDGATIGHVFFDETIGVDHDAIKSAVSKKVKEVVEQKKLESKGWTVVGDGLYSQGGVVDTWKDKTSTEILKEITEASEAFKKSEVTFNLNPEQTKKLIDELTKTSAEKVLGATKPDKGSPEAIGLTMVELDSEIGKYISNYLTEYDLPASGDKHGEFFFYSKIIFSIAHKRGFSHPTHYDRVKLTKAYLDRDKPKVKEEIEYPKYAAISLWVPEANCQHIMQYVEDTLHEAFIYDKGEDFEIPKEFSSPMRHHIMQAIAHFKPAAVSGVGSFWDPNTEQGALIHKTKYTHPVTKQGPFSIYSIIINLNDNHGWTREQIADWLDTLDDQPVFYPKEVANLEAVEEGTRNFARVVTLKSSVPQDESKR